MVPLDGTRFDRYRIHSRAWPPWLLSSLKSRPFIGEELYYSHSRRIFYHRGQTGFALPAWSRINMQSYLMLQHQSKDGHWLFQEGLGTHFKFLL